ncbi:MAG TPA: hypothetical protein ENK91_16770 [Bacteroidetes bacterium]|nr:hypothetical protein [Bacteroidota bacterium]
MEGSNAPVDPPLNEEKELRAEPNPTSGWTTFTWDEIGFTSLQVSDVFSGTIVTNQAIDPQSTSIQLDLTTLSGTFYSIRIEGEGKTPIYGRMIKANE